MKSKTFMKSKKTLFIVLITIALCALFSVTTAVTAFANSTYGSFLANAPYNSDYSSIDEVAQESAKVANQISAEGTVLLKNDGTLPLSGGLNVSIFGTHNNPMTQMASGLTSQGFAVNTNAVMGTGSIASENATLPRNYTASQKRKNEVLYNDAAIVVFSQAFGAVGGENSGFGFIQGGSVGTGGKEGGGSGNDIVDPGNAVVEDFKDYNNKPYLLPSGNVFKHKELACTIYDNEDKKYVTIYEDYDLTDTYMVSGAAKAKYTVTYYKHPLMLSEPAEELIAYTTENFDKVIVLFMSANQLEVGILEENPGISAILWSGDRDSKTDSYGVRNNVLQISKIVTGAINPSGKTINAWARDFTAATTWANDGNSGITHATVHATDVAAGVDGGVHEDRRIFHGSSFALGLRWEDENGDPGRYYLRPRRTGNNKRNHGLPVMYEEDIYMGYRYYETADAEAKAGNYAGFDYDDEVVYPFGHGLSYTNFKVELMTSNLDAWNDLNGSWDIKNWANDGKIDLTVKVTNTGTVAGKEVVQIYSHAPYYTGGIEKSEVSLVGFKKTKLLNPDASQTFKISVKIRDMASFDWNDKNDNGSNTYELDKLDSTNQDTNGNPLARAGDKYQLRIQQDSHNVIETLTLPDLNNDIVIDEDEFTGNKIKPLLNTKDLENTLGYDPGTDKTMVEEGKMTLLSRADFADSWPEKSTKWDMTRSDKYFKLLDTSGDYTANTFYTSNSTLVEQTTNGYNLAAGSGVSVAGGGGPGQPASRWISSNSSHIEPLNKPYYDVLKGDGAAASTTEDDSDLPWAITKSEFMTKTGNGTKTDWSQQESTEKQTAARAAAGKNWLTFADMKGVPANDAKWTKLLNQLTFDDLKNVIYWGGFSSYNDGKAGAIALRNAIDMPSSRHNDDMMGLTRQGTHSKLQIGYGDSPVNAATWNTDLQYKRGLLVGEVGLWSGVTGWYGVGGDLHRSAWGGRNPEYYGEDGFLMGHISGSHGAAAESKGLVTYIKHNALNESETGRYNRMTYVSEQAAREIYFKAFQIALQDYQLRGTMTSYNNIGDRQSSSHHAYQQKMIREEWGFKGLSITDALQPHEVAMTTDLLVRAGGSWMFDASQGTETIAHYNALSGKYDAANNKVTVDKRKVSADYKVADGKTYTTEVVSQVDAYTQWYYVRMSAFYTLYANANSATADRAALGLYVGQSNNGTGNPYVVDDKNKDQWLLDAGLLAENTTLNTKYKDVQFEVGVQLPTGDNSISVAPPTLIGQDAASAGYTYKLGAVASGQVTSSLPAGLTLNASNGTLSGTPTQAGTYTFHIWGGNLQGGWARNVQTFTLTVSSPSAIAAPVATIKDGAVTWEAISGAAGYEVSLNGTTYTVDGGTTTSFGVPVLPAGTYAICVRAISGSIKTDSAWSDAVNYVSTTGIYDDTDLKSQIGDINSDIGDINSDIKDLKEKTEETGCGSTIALGSTFATLAVILSAAFGIILIRKRKETK